MYPKNDINQVLKTQKSPIITSFFGNAIHSTLYQGNISTYLSTCTPSQKIIADVFLKYRYAQHVKLTNEYIAQEARCSTKTVTRCTNKFHADGFITKHQENQYSPNHYTFNDKVKKGKDAFSFWFNSLSEHNQDLYVTHGIRVDHKNKIIFSPRNVPQNNNIYIYNNYLYIKPIPIARARNGFVFKKTSKRELMKEHGVVTVKEFQKQWILTHKSDPRVKDLMNNDKIKTALFTPIIQKLTELLSLDEREQLKLVAFPVDAHQYAFEYIEPIVTGKKQLKKPVTDKIGWLLSIMGKFCDKNNINPDWRWYFELCEIIGIEKNTSTLVKKPLVLENLKPSKSLYPVWEEPKKDPIHVQIANKIKDIEKYQKQLLNPELYWKSGTFLYSTTIDFTKTLLLCAEQDLKTLRELEGYH